MTFLKLSVFALIVHIAHGIGCCVWHSSSGYSGCESWYGFGNHCGLSESNCIGCSSTWYSSADESAEESPVNHFVAGNTLTEHSFTVNSVTHYFYASNWDQT